MVCEGLVPQRIAAFAAADVEDPRGRADADRRGYAEIRSGAWNPAERLRDQEVDGVGFEVLYPSMALPMFGIPDTDLQYAVFAAYNDWIADYAAYDPSRMLGVGMICLDKVDHAVAELERVARLGLRGAMIAVDPDRPNYGSGRYDRVWEAASALELPLSLHILTRRAGAGYHQLPFLMTWMGHGHPAQLSITAMLATGVFHRFPDLKVVSVENDIGWIPHYLYKLEEAFHQFRYLIGYDCPDSPIDYFHRNVWFTFQDDPIGVQHLDMIGPPAGHVGLGLSARGLDLAEEPGDRRAELRGRAAGGRSASDLRQRHGTLRPARLSPGGARRAPPRSESYPARSATTCASLRRLSTSASRSGGISIPNSGSRSLTKATTSIDETSDSPKVRSQSGSRPRSRFSRASSKMRSSTDAMCLGSLVAAVRQVHAMRGKRSTRAHPRCSRCQRRATQVAIQCLRR